MINASLKAEREIEREREGLAKEMESHLSYGAIRLYCSAFVSLSISIRLYLSVISFAFAFALVFPLPLRMR